MMTSHLIAAAVPAGAPVLNRIRFPSAVRHKSLWTEGSPAPESPEGARRQAHAAAHEIAEAHTFQIRPLEQVRPSLPPTFLFSKRI
jgi:hypothetical protein